MASGFRMNQETSSGRTVKLNPKVRQLIHDALWKALTGLGGSLDQCRSELYRAMQKYAGRTMVTALTIGWNELVTEYHELCDEYHRDHAEQLTVDEKLRFFDDTEALIDRVNDDITHYLRTAFIAGQADGTRVSSGSGGDDTARIGERIRDIEKKMSAGKKIATSSATVTSNATYVTMSQTGPDPTRSTLLATAPPLEPGGHSSPYQAPARRALSSIQPGTPALDPSSNVLERLAALLQDKKDHLPRLEPEVYSGDVLTFPTWMASVEALIEKHTASGQERLFYLGKYTAGEAREAISGFLVLHSEDAYDLAKNLLVARYGDKVIVARAYRAKLFLWPTIKKGDATALRRYSDFLWQCQAAMDTIGHLDSLNTAEENARIVKVLPTYLVERWVKIVDRWYYHEDPVESQYGMAQQGEFPPFIELCRLVSRESRIASGPINSLLQEAKQPEKTQSKSPGQHVSRSFASSVTTADDRPAMNEPSKGHRDATKDKEIKCYFCQERHFVSCCDKFLKLPAAERKDFAAQNHLCFGCLGKGHSYRLCRNKHPELLKDSTPEPSKPTTAKKSTSMKTERAESASDGARPAYYSMVVPIVVSHVDRPEHQLTMYGLLDTQSDSTFIDDDVLAELGAPVEEVDLDLVTMGSTHHVRSNVVEGLVVRGLYETATVRVDECFSRSHIPANDRQIPTPEAIETWPHLEVLRDKLAPRDMGLKVGMLIGHDCPTALMTTEICCSSDEEPFGVRTRLGWSLMGPRMDPEAVPARHCYMLAAKKVGVREVSRAFDMEFEETGSDGGKMSQDDLRFVESATDSIRIQPDGHFQLKLPFRCDRPTMPNNRDVAYKRLMTLRRKMTNDAEYCRVYSEFMETLIRNGHAERVTSSGEAGKVNYMPHHGVVHPRKPGQVRGVFDSSAEKEGVSLNQMLLPGPDLTNNLVGVLCNFRLEKVAFMCDVKGMFLQVTVPDEQRDYMRFLWFRDGDPRQDVVEYRMTVNFAFRHLTEVYADEFSEEVHRFIREHFYVDDGLQSRATAREVVELFMSSHQLCAKGGFLLHKFTSNSQEAIEAVPDELLAKTAAQCRLNPMIEHVDTSLGITWDRLRDVFLFLVKEYTRGHTRRCYLSALSGVYDPIGFVSPVVLVGRQLLQELCFAEIGWDDAVADEFKTRWMAWWRELTGLVELAIPRCLRERCSAETVKRELHHFSDASTVGLGACSYLKTVDADGEVDVTLVMAKARVAPKKLVTMPRMELQAALIAARQADFLSRQLRIPDVRHWYWSDSTVTLGYITNPSRRFQLYVANRVQQINQLTDRARWSHVAGTENPADLASRGCGAAELIGSELWWHGPRFLREFDGEGHREYAVDDDDKELKRERTVAVTKTEPTWFGKYCSIFSSWRRLMVATATLRRFAVFIGTPRESRPTTIPRLQVSDLQQAKRVLICRAQAEGLGQEMTILAEVDHEDDTRAGLRSRKLKLRQNSTLHRLDAYLDDQGVIRVGGRMRRAYLPVDQGNPMVLPRCHQLTRLAVRHAHERVHHGGRQATIASLREMGLWVIHARATTDAEVNRCITCRKLKASPMTQKMADLPPFRVQESAPFTYCGADLFGPIKVKDGRSMRKYWICLFTCFASRACHLEPVSALTTDSFLNALRRLINRRGSVRQIRCDNGTNFVGAANELQSCFDEMEDEKIRQELLQRGCDWVSFKFNPPTASHMGGLWERMVKSAKAVYYQLLKKYGDQLSPELLYTLTTEVEYTLNSRPLTSVNPRDPWSEPPLTPNRLLHMKGDNCGEPPGHFVEADIYSVHQWRRVQLLASKFWDQWRTEFLPDLQTRSKWNNVQYNLAKGDVVAMVDPGVRRNQWPLGIVEEVRRSDDDLVRSALIRTETSVLERPIAKLVHICSSDE